MLVFLINVCMQLRTQAKMQEILSTFQVHPAASLDPTSLASTHDSTNKSTSCNENKPSGGKCSGTCKDSCSTFCTTVTDHSSKDVKEAGGMACGNAGSSKREARASSSTKFKPSVSGCAIGERNIFKSIIPDSEYKRKNPQAAILNHENAGHGPESGQQNIKEELLILLAEMRQVEI